MAASDPESTAVPPDDSLARAAEDEAAAAEARAEEARARADELRRRIEAAEAAAEETPAATQPPAVPTPATPAVRVLPAVGLGAAAVVAAGLLGLTGYLLWQHKAMAQQQRGAAEFAAAARQDVINLMSIDYNTADDSVKRVLDGSTGRFQKNFAETADDFVKALKDEKIITKATVNDAAVESMTGESAVVLVSATSRREGPQAPKDQQEPRLWRIVVSLERDGGQIKMSGVEFV
jgi:Mce-associated membrane protein